MVAEPVQIPYLEASFEKYRRPYFPPSKTSFSVTCSSIENHLPTRSSTVFTGNLRTKHTRCTILLKTYPRLNQCRELAVWTHSWHARSKAGQDPVIVLSWQSLVTGLAWLTRQGSLIASQNQSSLLKEVLHKSCILASFRWWKKKTVAIS